jgi:hypothetical protein
MRSGGKGQPSARARVRTLAFVRLNAAVARRAELPEPRKPSGVHRLAASMADLLAASQRPKIIAPIVKMAAPIQMTMAAFFSEMLGVGFMNQINREQPIGSCTDRRALDAPGGGGARGWVDRLPNCISTARRRGAIRQAHHLHSNGSGWSGGGYAKITHRRRYRAAARASYIQFD